MSTFKNPVGPQPAKVYWRRRLLLGLGVVAVIVVIILIIVRPGSNAGTPTPGKTNSSAASDPSNAPTTGTACLPANLTLVAVTDKVSYAAADKPQISMKITNAGTVPCTINLGSTQQELIITSGSEQIWDSKDCQTGAVDSAQTLEAGKSLSTPPITWDRTRSSKTTCDATRTPVTAGGASYHLGVKVGTLASKETVQFLLN